MLKSPTITTGAEYVDNRSSRLVEFVEEALSGIIGSGSVDNNDNCFEPCTVYIGSNHLERSARRKLCGTRPQCRVVEQTNTAVVSQYRQLICPCTRLFNELEAGWCTSYQVRRCGVVMPRLSESGNTEVLSAIHCWMMADLLVTERELKRPIRTVSTSLWRCTVLRADARTPR